MKTIKLFCGNIIAIAMFAQLSCIKAQNQQPGIAPVMKISNSRPTEVNPMRLDNLKVDIKVVGQIAITTLDMTYFNSNYRILEGEFEFPLGEGQSISRFALDINGALREGVVVDKEQGRKTFEAIVRRGVDPGLLEMTEGNNFRSRVYPLPANGTRRIVIAFEQELSDKGDFDLYLLPLNIKEMVKNFSLHVEVVKNEVKIDNQHNEFSNISFERWNDAYIAIFEKSNFTPDKQIALSFPHMKETKVFTALKNNQSDSSYFYISVRPEKFNVEKQLPKHITILWDNSNSADKRNIEKEFAILDAYISKIKNLSIELVPFNIQTEQMQKFDIKNGDWKALRTSLENMIYDGGTSFGVIPFRSLSSDEILLFSDGISTFGNPNFNPSNTPVITINSSLVADHSFLTFLAQASGGKYINLNKYTTEEALSMLVNSNYQFISATVEKGSVTDMYPSIPTQFVNSFNLAGKMTGKSATLVLNFGYGNKIVHSSRVEVNAEKNIDTDIVRRIWAEKKIDQLSLNAEKNLVAITQTGKEFGIVTQNTSLIVLENLNDYLQYHIVPPKEMQADYYKHFYTVEKDEKERIKTRLDYVVNLSDEQSKWWNTNYSLEPVKPEPKKVINAQFSNPMVTDSEASLQEVVVVGYGAARRSHLTGAVASVSSNKFVTVDMKDEISSAPVMEEEMMVNEMSSAAAVSTEAIIQNKGGIEINAWDPETPYLKVLQYAALDQIYPTYLRLKKEYGSIPSFYLDASDFFAKNGKNDTATKILSNLAELKLEAPSLLRVLGNKLIALHKNAEAVLVFEKVLKIKGEEPQSYRDLGLALKENGDLQQALITLYQVITKEWNSRFPGIEIIALNEINNIIHTNPKLDYSFIDKRLIKKEPVDVRVVLTWDTDNCDMDLWVTEPTGEKCMYSHKLTQMGGKITNDFTQGYGPEEYMVKKAISGDYTVEVNYFGTRSQQLLAPVNLTLTFYTNYGKPNQKKLATTIRLENQSEIVNAGKFKF